MCCPAQKAVQGDGRTSGLALDCGGTASTTEPLAYLGSPPYCGSIMNCFKQKNGAARCLAQRPRGGSTTKKADPTTTAARPFGFTTHADSPKRLAPPALTHTSSLV